jgi:glycosyltransferase involved in cell wall biosynthesis
MKITYFILNRFDYDSRARLEVETLRSMGHEVVIIATVGGEMKEFLGCPIHRVSQQTWPSRKVRFIQYNLAARSIGERSKSDIYHAVDLDALYAAHRAAKRTGGRLIYESRELYTELEALKGRGTVTAFWRLLERRLIGRADKVITINDSIADELVRRYDIDRPEIIRNVAPAVGEIESEDLRLKLKIALDHKIIIYQGILRKGQGLIYLLSILQRLDGVTLVLAGEGPIEGRLRELAAELGVAERVKFAGMVHPDELHKYTAGADAGLLLMEDVALNNRFALPQKIFQYLSAGIPQIVSPMPEIARFVEDNKTGIVISLGDPARDAFSINRFLMDKSGYRSALDRCRIAGGKFNWAVESEKLVKIYRELER